jgi:hypothetical protein
VMACVYMTQFHHGVFQLCARPLWTSRTAPTCSVYVDRSRAYISGGYGEMGHSLGPRCHRKGLTWGGMVSCKEWCCGVQQWPGGANMNRKKHWLHSWLTRGWLGHRGCAGLAGSTY